MTNKDVEELDCEFKLWGTGDFPLTFDTKGELINYLQNRQFEEGDKYRIDYGYRDIYMGPEIWEE